MIAEFLYRYSGLKGASEASEQLAAMLSALSDCADDLESEVRDRWCYVDGEPHPALQHKFERDMEPVRRARALIAAQGMPPEGPRREGGSGPLGSASPVRQDAPK